CARRPTRTRVLYEATGEDFDSW
nr:immunoglobulin heavy chain junction region [Macaca mulatta]MOX58935.1 immunoglobulin heavy chain junction region [Macaca mulatta]MOX59151.1 immunoglobulin heavy chain junction region [Macaca mulatta]MOX59354.1 immunoglobulin heavy chain junction region [Macaca mulatta]MOX61142.1 immunoglobulin heavy chain junction region [Macaca mulatta]